MSASSSKSAAARSKRRNRSHRHAPDEARREILDSAARFLRKRDFRDLTVGKIMSGTTLSRPACYQYFADVHDLIVFLLHEIEAILHQTATPWISGEGELIAALPESNRGVVEAAPLDERLEQAWTSFMERWGDTVDAQIVAQQQDNLVPSCNAQRIAKALKSLDVNLVVAAFRRHPQDDPKEALETKRRIWSCSLYGRPSHALTPTIGAP